jgi:hypothetical protein
VVFFVAILNLEDYRTLPLKILAIRVVDANSNVATIERYIPFRIISFVWRIESKSSFITLVFGVYEYTKN